jgi:glycosyltransferase involved in cell wall biosynthesis
MRSGGNQVIMQKMDRAMGGSEVIKEPLVTVIMPTHNRASKIGGALESLLNQSYRNLEVVVVDDASSDDTYKVLTEMQAEDPRLVLLRNEKNLGCSGARNRGLRVATGDYLAFLDDDDEYLPDSIAIRVSMLLNDPQIDVLVANFGGNATEANAKPYGWLEKEFSPHRVFDPGRVMCKRNSIAGIQFRGKYMEWRDFAFQIYQRGLSVHVSEQTVVRVNKSAGSLSTHSQNMLSFSLANAKLYHEATEGSDEHDLFTRYLADRYKDMGNFSLKNGRLISAFQMFARAARTGKRFRDAIPFC